VKLGTIATAIEGRLVGASDVDVMGVLPIDHAKAGYLTFVLRAGSLKDVASCTATAFVTYEEIPDLPNQIVVSNSKKALSQVIDLFHPTSTPDWHVSNATDISSSAQLGAPIHIGSFSSVGADSKIGDHTIIHSRVSIGRDCHIGSHVTIYPGVTLYDRVHIGDNVVIHAGASIGIDGFGYYSEDKTWQKVSHVGHTIIEDDVEIGGGTCIDRGCLGDTVIKKGTKIDNHVHIAHNVSIGAHCVITPGTCVGGSASVGNHVMMGAQVGIRDGISIGDHVVIMTQTGVTKSIPDRSVISGFPAQDHRTQQKYEAKLRKLTKQ